MLPLTIPTKAEKDFLDGNGKFTFATEDGVWTGAVAKNAPFTPQMDAVVDVGVALDAGSKAFGFGRNGGLSLTVSGGAAFSHQVQLLWPGQESDEAAARQRGLTIPAGHYFARIRLGGEARGAADAKFPVGPISAKVGIGAGGHATYERWLLQPAAAGARDVLTALYAGLRLPQSVDTAGELPGEGEVLALSYGGYLKLNAGLTWGYEMKGTRSLDVPQMPLDLSYQFRAMAAVNVGYQLAGEYQIEVRRAAENWARFTVRKSRESETTLAADFGLTGQIGLQGLPASADEFLAKLFGVHAERVLELFDKGRQYSDLKELEAAAGKLLAGAVRHFTQGVAGQAALAKVQAMAKAYEQIGARVVGLYHDALREQVPAGVKSKVEVGLDALLGVATREQFAALSGRPEFAAGIDLLRKLYNDALFEVLQKDEAFAKAVVLAKKARMLLTGGTEADAMVKGWIDAVQALSPVDGLLKQLATQDIQKVTEERLQGVVEKLAGKAWEKLDGSDFKKVTELVHNNLNKVEEFKNKWYGEAVKAVTKQSFTMNLHLAYSRARRNEKLVEVEVNLAHPEGPALARAAAAGDFEELLQRYDTAVVRILQGAFRNELQSSLGVKFNVLGYESEGLVTLFQRSEQAFEARDGGLLHVFTSETYVERKAKSGGKFKETVNSKFLVQAIGESFQRDGTAARPYAVDVLRSMTSSFGLFHSDDRTTPEELTEYLRLAGELGLLDQEPRSYVDGLVRACGGNLGKVTLTYRVGFGTDSLKKAFQLVGDPKDPDGGALGREARQAMRGFLWRKFAASKKPTDWFARVAFAYATDIYYRLYRRHELNAAPRGITLPPWFTGFSQPEQANLRPNPELILLDRIYAYEDKMVKGLLAVDAQVDALSDGAVDWEKLNKAILQMVDAAGAVADYDDSCFPVILDRLIQVSSNGTAKRDSTLLLEVESPVVGKITRVLAGGPRNPEEIAEE